MPKGKLRSPEEINRMLKDIRRSHRPLLRQMEVLEIREKTLAWVMGEDDSFVVVEEPTTEESEELAADSASE